MIFLISYHRKGVEKMNFNSGFLLVVLTIMLLACMKLLDKFAGEKNKFIGFVMLAVYIMMFVLWFYIMFNLIP